MADKRELKVRLVPNKGSIYEIYYAGGGEIPDELKSMYTSAYEASVKITHYLFLEKKRLERAAELQNKKDRMNELRERGLA